jgi:hypothetical protein
MVGSFPCVVSVCPDLKVSAFSSRVNNKMQFYLDRINEINKNTGLQSKKNAIVQHCWG